MKIPKSFGALVRAVLLLTSVGLCASPAFAVDRFVATNGVNATSGGRGLSVGLPYQTIDYAAAQALPGDTIHIRGGTYRETVTPNVSGTANAPIVFKPYNNEAVTITGLNLITPGSGGAGSWSLDTGSIYKIQLTANFGSDSGWSIDRITGCQVFVNGEAMSEARWPNSPTPMGIRRTEAATAVTGAYTAAGTAGSLIYNALYRHPGLDDFAADVWQHGIIVFAPGAQWYRRVAPITGNTPAGAASEVRFTFDPYNEGSNREDADIGDPFFLMGRKVALDAEREFFFDTIQGATSTVGRDGPRHMLYLRMPGSVSPVGQVVEMRRRMNAIDLSNVAHVHFENLRILAGRIRTRSTSSNCVFRGLNVEYAAYTWEEEFGSDYDSMLIEGTGHQILDGSLKNSTNRGIYFASGGGHLVRNLVVSDCFLSGIEMRPAASNIRVENVTVFNLAGSGISAEARPNQVLFSHGYQSGLFITDCGLLNALDDVDGLDSEWAYNWMHDALGSVNSARDWYGTPAIRLDFGPTNFRIHHNVVWNTTQPEKSIAIWGVANDQLNYLNAKIRLYNNTVDQQIGFIETYNSPASLKGVELSNNLTGVGVNIASSGTDATGKLYFDDVVIRNNLFPNRAFPNNPVPPHLNNRQGATGWVAPASPPFGYQLDASSQARNNGVVIPGITDGFIGAGPDLGAYESGRKPFVPGAKVRAQDLAALTVTPTVVGGTVKFVVAGMPTGRSLPDTFHLKIAGHPASNDFSHTFDFVNNTVAATFTALSVPGADQAVQVSLDGTTFVTLPATLTVPASTLAATATSLATSATPVMAGGLVTFTATVSSASGTPSGTVTFFDDTATLGTGTLDGSGVATFATSSLAVGRRAISAVYTATASHAASTSPFLDQTIETEPPAPAGVVRARFTDGDGVISAQQYPGASGDGWLAGWTTSGGTANTSTASPLAPGSGSYLRSTRTSGSGGGSQAGFYRQWDGAVRPYDKFSRLTFDCRLDSSTTFDNSGDAYSITLTNTPSVAPTAANTTVYLRCFGASPGNDANGNSIRAREWCVFNGTPGTEDAYAVNKFVRTGLIAVPGRTYSFTVDLYAASAAGTTAGKTHGTYDVTITDRTDNTTVSVLGSGFRSANYTSGGYVAFASQQNLATDNLTFSVDSLELTGPPVTLALASSANPSLLGASVTLTATVSGTDGTPAGTVTFFDGPTPLGSAALNGSGVATLATAALALGEHTITVAYPLSATYAASVSPTFVQTIAPPPTPLEVWRAQYFTPAELANGTLEATLWGHTADSDGDGLDNLLERALGGHPREPSSSALPTAALDLSGRLTISFIRAVADLTYIVEGTGDLLDPLSWAIIATNPGEAGQPVVVPDEAPLGTTPRFLRLRVTE